MSRKKARRKAPDLVLAINPGSTSTKIALFRAERCLFEELLSHSRSELAPFRRVADQHELRRKAIRNCLERRGYRPGDSAAISARGGLTKPIPGGVYAVNRKMIRDLESAKWGEHPSNLGAPIAAELAREGEGEGEGGCRAFVVDPPVVDEMWGVARYSGHPDIERRSVFHALSQRAAARLAAKDLGTRYESENFVVAHMGAGISVGAHRRGKVVDVNNALDGEGPFSPERTGTLPAGDVVRWCFSGNGGLDEIVQAITRNGGLSAYLKTNDCREIEKMIKRGGKRAKLVYEAMAYQIAKEIGAQATALAGRVKAVVLTGGMAASGKLVRMIRNYAGFLAPFMVYPRMEEMRALAAGALAALNGRIKVKEYR